MVGGLSEPVAEAPWPALSPNAIPEEQARRWLLPPVYKRLSSGQGDFLAELRPNVALFLLFKGIDYDHNEAAQEKLDAFVRYIQQTLARYEATLIQLTIGDKGSYLSAAFGAPLAHEDDPARALSAALELRRPPLEYIGEIQIGICSGRMRTGAYGSNHCRTYGMMADEVNLAARLMQAAVPTQILVTRSVCQNIEGFRWEELAPIQVKGKTKPIEIFSLLGKQDIAAVLLQEPKYLLPMVGRLAELSILAQALEKSLNGQGQLVAITGEAGLGKSRLVAEAIRLVNVRAIAGYSGECQSYGTNISYLAWQTIWWGIFQPGSGGWPRWAVSFIRSPAV